MSDGYQESVALFERIIRITEQRIKQTGTCPLCGAKERRISQGAILRHTDACPDPDITVWLRLHSVGPQIAQHYGPETLQNVVESWALDENLTEEEVMQRLGLTEKE